MKYEELALEVVPFAEGDVITASVEEDDVKPTLDDET